jgi:uncharacterized protein (UPF0335 family)
MSQFKLDETGKKALRDFCGELSGAMTRIEGEQVYIREAMKDFAEETKIDKKVLRKIVKFYHKQNFITQSSENAEVESFYQQIFGVE